MVDKAFLELKEEITSGMIRPLYLFHGVEDFFIDQLCNLLEEHVVPVSERGFNVHILYGKDIQLPGLLNLARSFPMMSDRQLVLVKEAQQIHGLNNKEHQELLLAYLNNPQTCTVLALAHKHKNADSRQKWVKAFSTLGKVYKSNEVRDYQMPKVAEAMIKEKGLHASPKAIQLLVDHVGADLGRLNNELEKVMMNLNGEKELKVDDIEKNIGISRSHNPYELQKALAAKDHHKAQQICHYFSQNSKTNPLPRTLVILTDFFKKTMLVHAAGTNNEIQLAQVLQVNPFFVKDYLLAARNYPVGKVAKCFSYLREANRRFVGIGQVTMSEKEITRELVFKLIFG